MSGMMFSILSRLMAPPKPTLHSRLLPTTGTILLQATQQWEANAVLEPTILQDTNEVLLFYTGSQADDIHHIGLAYAPDMESAFTKLNGPIIGLGIGGATSSNSANSSCAVKENGSYYVFATAGYGIGGGDSCVYLYSSPNAKTTAFTGLGKILDLSAFPGIQRFGNTSIPVLNGAPQKIGGQYIMLIEAFTGSRWEIHRATATTLTGPWTIIQKLPTLSVNSQTIYGGPCHKYINGVWHEVQHYGLGGSPRDPINLPTVLSYAQSTDSINWVTKEAPFMGIEATPYTNTDQIADAWIEQCGSATYMVAEYVDNTSPIHSQIRKWKFNGTIDQLFNGL